MYLYKGTNRLELLKYIAEVASTGENNFWRVLTSICEILPDGTEDKKQGLGLLANKDSLMRESKNLDKVPGAQTTIF
jgi:hypothetical protein